MLFSFFSACFQVDNFMCDIFLYIIYIFVAGQTRAEEKNKCLSCYEKLFFEMTLGDKKIDDSKIFLRQKTLFN